MNIRLAILICLLLLAGCGHSPESDSDVVFNPEDVKIMQPVAGQRFTPTTSALVSYDTWTGQLCKTYQWDGQTGKSIDSCSLLARFIPSKN